MTVAETVTGPEKLWRLVRVIVAVADPPAFNVVGERGVEERPKSGRVGAQRLVVVTLASRMIEPFGPLGFGNENTSLICRRIPVGWSQK